MPRLDGGELASLETQWKNNPCISGATKVDILALADVLRRKAADNHNSLDGLELYFPSDCRNYDAFMIIVNAFNALVIPTGNGYIARCLSIKNGIEIE